MRQAFKDVLLRSGFLISRSPGDVAVRDVLSLIYPVGTNIPLVRLGGAGDGGYLVPDDLTNVQACFSPGVDYTASFELALAERGVVSFLADASVPEAPVVHPKIHFLRKFIGPTSRDRFITMDDWVSTSIQGSSGDLILQMDIEGAEWGAILGMSGDLLSRFRIIVLELHGLSSLFEPFGHAIIKDCFIKLTEKFYVVHSHPNNSLPSFRSASLTLPYTLEITLLRKDRATAVGYGLSFPNALDFDCVPERAHVALSPDLRSPTSPLGASTEI